ncbi:MAG: helix-turn-helix transcriptional regulator [Candidatus Aenigmatarchaeota archaeon]
MKNRYFGVIILIIAGLIGFIVYSFNRALKKIGSMSCPMGTACPMWATIEFQTNVSIAIMVLVVAIGMYFIFFGDEVRVITKVKRVKPKVEMKKVSKDSYKEIFNKLSPDERTVLEKVIDAEGAIFQSELIEKTKFSKAKVTRILDKLEANGLIERKRKGMSNIVVLKNRIS